MKTPEQTAIHKWIKWTFNYTPSMTVRMLHDIAASDHDVVHLRLKLSSYSYNWNRFYCECDCTLQKRMVDWLMENFNG